MNEVITVKITCSDKEDFDIIAKLLEAEYKVVATTRAIYDVQRGDWHIFLSCTKRDTP